MANRVMTLGRDRGRAPAGWPRGPTLKSHPEVVVRARLAAMATVARPVLLERDAELDELLAGARDAERGRGRLVVVEGPAGIGKTGLLREARERAPRAGMRVLAARAAELERDFPFAVVRQLLEPPLAAADDDTRRELLGGAAAPAAAVVGTPPDDPAAERSADPSFAALNGLYW